MNRMLSARSSMFSWSRKKIPPQLEPQCRHPSALQWRSRVSNMLPMCAESDGLLRSGQKT